MSVPARLGALARLVSRSRLGRGAAVGLYRGAARASAAGLVRVPRVQSVLLTGSLTRPERLDPGHSDIDLVAACDFGSDQGEIETTTALIRWQAKMSRLGGLFYNLDCLDTVELPHARAFGGAWETRLDRQGRALVGDKWPATAQRPPEELELDRFSGALRRWINSGALLLDPSMQAPPHLMLRTARRLLIDVVEGWTELDLTRADSWTAVGERATAASLTHLAEVVNRGITRTRETDVVSLLLPAAVEALDSFALQVVRHLETPIATVGEPRFETPAALASLGRTLLGSPFETILLLHRGPHASDLLPIVLAESGVSASELVSAAARRLAAASSSLEPLRYMSRRITPFSAAMWRAAALLEPAPFTGAAAQRPLWVEGKCPTAPAGPSAPLMHALLRMRVVQSFSLCRGPELRPKWTKERLARTLSDRHALLAALDLAVEDGVIDVSWSSAQKRALAPFPERVRALRAFSARHREKLEPLLYERLGRGR